MAGSSAGVIGASVGPDYRLAGRVSGGRSGRPRGEARWWWSTRGSFAASACPCERGETGEPRDSPTAHLEHPADGLTGGVLHGVLERGGLHDLVEGAVLRLGGLRLGRGLVRRLGGVLRGLFRRGLLGPGRHPRGEGLAGRLA